jgi:hypothetical protein
MTPQRWLRIERLYHAALQQPADKRGEYVARECAADETLRREVESLLRNAARRESWTAMPSRLPRDITFLSNCRT